MRAKSLSTLAGAVALAVFGMPIAWAQGSGPVTQPDFATLDEDTLVVLYPLLNDTDPQDGGLTLTSVSVPSTGTARADGPAVVFTPDPDWNGVIELTYTVSSAGGEATEDITFTVQPVNDAPDPADDSVQAVSGEPTTVDVLANDLDVDGDDLVVGAVVSPMHGSATVVAGSIEYTSDTGFTGTDSFAYTVRDAAGESAQAAVIVTVAAPVPTTTVAPTTTVPVTTVPVTTVAPTTLAPTTTAVPTPTVPPTTVAPTTTTAPAPTAVPLEFPEGTTLVPSPLWAAPSAGLSPAPGTGNPDGFFGALESSVGSLALPLLLLLAVGTVAWLVARRGGRPSRKYAVVLVGRVKTLAVHEKAADTSPVLHNFDYSARQIDVVGRKRSVDGVDWLPVSTADGRGWVQATYLTEDVARATFDADLAERDLIRDLRRKLKGGSTIVCSARGSIDPETYERDPSRRQLGGHATAKLAALIGDWRAAFHIDKTASLAALRPPELRNLHWVSLEAPGLDPWQLFFEYHDGHAYAVAALPENVSVPV